MAKKDKVEETQTAEAVDHETIEQPEAAETDTPQEETSAEPAQEDPQKQIDELKDKYIRMYAEFENYKKRSMREKMDWMRSAAQDTMSALLPVLDDFDRAKKFADEKSETGWSDGVELVYQKLYNALKAKGLTPMESNGQPFDPEFHDAITEIPAPSDDLKGKVIDTIEKGYRLNDKIIRHAKVVVGK